MNTNGSRGWGFVSSHARVRVAIAHDPGTRLRDISDRVGITERAAHRIVADFDAAGYITRTRSGRRNNYTIQAHLPLPDAIDSGQSVGDLLAVLAKPPVDRAAVAVRANASRDPAAAGGGSRSAAPSNARR
jgi:hypothetical protein